MLIYLSKKLNMILNLSCFPKIEFGVGFSTKTGKNQSRAQDFGLDFGSYPDPFGEPYIREMSTPDH